MATYHGIVKAECLGCEYSTEDDFTLELWNDAPMWGHCPECGMRKGFTRWTLADGTVRLIEHDEHERRDYIEERNT